MVAVADRHDEVRADERHDLAGLDQLGGGGGLVVLDVGDGLEHHEQRVVVALQLGPLVGGDGVLDGQLVQAEGLGDGRDLVVGRARAARSRRNPRRARRTSSMRLVVGEAAVEALRRRRRRRSRRRRPTAARGAWAAGSRGRVRAQRRADRGQGVLGQRGHRRDSKNVRARSRAVMKRAPLEPQESGRPILVARGAATTASGCRRHRAHLLTCGRGHALIGGPRDRLPARGVYRRWRRRRCSSGGTTRSSRSGPSTSTGPARPSPSTTTTCSACSR